MKAEDLFRNGCVLFEAVGDERRFTLPMIRILKEQYGVRAIALVRFVQDKKPLMETGLFEAAYSTSEMLDDAIRQDGDLMCEARKLEAKYDTVFHYNLCDRRLYFTGCTSFPYTRVETGESYEGWIGQFVATYHGVEDICRRHGVTVALNGRRVVNDVAKGLGLHVRSLGYSFLHDRMVWRDGLRINGTWLAKAHEKVARTGEKISASILEPPPFHMSVRRSFFDGIRLSSLIKTTSLIIARTLYWHLRKYDKVVKFGYSAHRHIRFNWRRRRVYKHLVKHGTRADDLIHSGRPFVFMALQMEPEVLLSSQTPEFYDQIAMIHQVAKELPVGTFLAIKDHVPALGYRDMSFYRMLDTMPNVVLIDPTDYAIPLIKEARAVVSLLGRSAFEAAAFGVPVLAYSPNLFFAYLDHVRVCTDMANVRSELHALLSYTEQDRKCFAVEGERLLAAVNSTTIDPAEYDGDEAVGQALLGSLVESFEDDLSAPAAA
jgi:hypothetical protein